MANLLNIDLSRKVLGLVPVCLTAGPTRYIHCRKELQQRGSEASRLWDVLLGSVACARYE